MTAVQTPRRAEPGTAPVRRRRRPVTPRRVLLHVFLVVTSLVFLFPLLYAMYTSLRPYAETAKYGYFSLPRGLTFVNYTHAWQQSLVLHFLVNTLIIVVPSLILILLL